MIAAFGILFGLTLVTVAAWFIRRDRRRAAAQALLGRGR